jgi:hypothetical protein
MIKIHRIVKGTTATLLAALAFVMTGWTHARPAPPPPRGTESIRAVKLRLTLDSGDWANVTEPEGGTITIEKNGKKLAITPFIREQGQVELRVFKVIQSEGKETMKTAGTLLVGKELTKFEASGLLKGVQVLDANKKLPSDVVAVAGSSCCTNCCVRTCAGALVCGVCVCTDCGRCGPGWCDCAQP